MDNQLKATIDITRNDFNLDKIGNKIIEHIMKQTKQISKDKEYMTKEEQFKINIQY